MILIIAISSVLLNAFAQLALKWGVSDGRGPHLSEGIANALLTTISNPGILAGLSFYSISVCIWIYVLSRLEVSVAYPLLSIGYIVNLLLAAWLFGEPITIHKVIGIGLIMTGVLVLYKGAQS